MVPQFTNRKHTICTGSQETKWRCIDFTKALVQFRIQNNTYKAGTAYVLNTESAP